VTACARFHLPDDGTPNLAYGAALITPSGTAAEVLDAADVRLLERKRERKVGRSFAAATAAASA
jgi:hypothetical protein